MDYDGLVDGLVMVKFDTAEDVHCKTTLHAAADGVIAHFIVPWKSPLPLTVAAVSNSW